MLRNIKNYCCYKCLNQLPFKCIDDNEFKYLNCQLNINSKLYEIYNKCTEFNFKSFSYTDYTNFDFENDVDPENNFYNNIDINCNYYTDCQFKENVTKVNGVSLIHFNARGLNKNLNEIKSYLSQLNYYFDVIAISETGVKEHCIDNYDLDGYNVQHVCRKNTKSGGVSIYVRDCFDYKLIKNMSIDIEDVMECVTIEINFQKSANVIFTCVYRKCGSCIEIFNDKFTDILNEVKNKKKSHFICGDFNIDLLKYECNKGTTDFVDLMYSIGFLPLINKPSRITTESATIIDNIFTNDINYCSNYFNGLLINDISDHLPVFVICNKNVDRNVTKKYVQIRSINNNNIVSLQNELSAQSWESVINSDDVNVAYSNFVNIFNLLLDKHCPVKKICITNKKDSKPWFTNGLRNACKKKNTLYKQFLRCQNKTVEEKYKKYKNKLTNILRCSEKSYYDDLLKLNQNDIKGTWKVLNSIVKKSNYSACYPEHFLENNKNISSKIDIANGFNNFFVNVGPNLAKDINTPDDGNIFDYLRNRNCNSMFLHKVDENEVIQIVNTFKNKTSNDYNNMNMSILKNVISNIKIPLTDVCNKSFISGTFPDEMKIGKVVPIFKAGEKNNFSNYRPISILPQFSKVLEKLFCNRLDNFLDKCNILNENQYGFRSNRSTSYALLELMEKITDSIDKKKYIVGVFIDLKKAFDTIDHSILLKKLEFYGVRGIALDWLSSYLRNRKQYVEIDNVMSFFLDIICGVPQGSILGPKLFILYINDICNVSCILDFILFADDTNIFCSSNNIKELCKIVTCELNKLNIWFALNKLSLNIKKTNYMIFCNKTIPDDLQISINNIVIERVKSTKFLGVMIDDNLNWKMHISHVKSKLSKSIAIIYKSKFILSQESLYLLYCTLFLPYLTYCLEIWGSSYVTNINPLFILQKKIIRIVSNCSYKSHTNELFYNLKIVKFFDLIKLKICTIMYKAEKKLLPLNILNLFSFQVSTNYNTRNRNKIRQKFARTTLKSMCISVHGIKLWNDLNENIKKCENVKLFVKYYKLEIINRYKIEQ